ncbi:MAG TPA: hypothetical protein DHV86_04325 [Methylophilaceae bacterium]|nr:hypothetical protein [Methylophilaceae bacterium]
MYSCLVNIISLLLFLAALSVSFFSLADTEKRMPEDGTSQHYTHKIFRNHSNELVKKNNFGECITGDRPTFNLTTDYENFSTLRDCLASGGKLPQ